MTKADGSGAKSPSIKAAAAAKAPAPKKPKKAEEPEPIRVLPGYGRGQEEMPVYKMPHLEGWALTGQEFVLPAVGHHEVLWVDANTLEETARTGVAALARGT